MSPIRERVGSGSNQQRELELCVVLQAQLGILDGRRIVGYLHCTHLQAPVGELCRRGCWMWAVSLLSCEGSRSLTSPTLLSLHPNA